MRTSWNEALARRRSTPVLVGRMQMDLISWQTGPLASVPLWFDGDLPAACEAWGRIDLLDRPGLALLCSVDCPGDLMLKTYDLSKLLAKAGVCCIGGFHSPVEREFLLTLERRGGPVIVCPAHSLAAESTTRYSRLAECGRLLLLSPFESWEARITVETAAKRNMFMVALADRVFVSNARSGGKVERLCRQAIDRGKRVFTFDSKLNQNIVDMGAVGVSCDDAGLGRIIEDLDCDGDSVSPVSG